MKTISEIDSNFQIPKTNSAKDCTFYNVREYPFKVYGLMHDGTKFIRLPENVASSVNEGVYRLFANTAGGRVKFKTDSDTIIISAKMHSIGKMPHFALVGSAGFDLYNDTKYLGTFMPPYDLEDGYECEFSIENSSLSTYTINFPTYSGVYELYIGLKNGSVLEETSEYKYKKPIVYYGSSITQGGCTSRPGNTYEEIISRNLDTDYINLGFSGSARGEKEISEYIQSLDMSIFVYDYDFNAPTPSHLEATHERMFTEIRNAKPDIPIVMLSRPRLYLTSDEEKQKQTIIKTYNNAISKGDKNVYFIDGQGIFADFGDSCTVDSIHPNDLGFTAMARSIMPVLKKLLND